MRNPQSVPETEGQVEVGWSWGWQEKTSVRVDVYSRLALLHTVNSGRQSPKSDSAI